MISHNELRQLYLNFFEERGHTVIEASPLVLQGDATTLFTSSGMQPLVPFLSGREVYPSGKRLVNIQPCVRTQDIDEVGDNRHTTFFEMMGNWSLGDYFKGEQLSWIWEFFTDTLSLPREKLYVTVYAGGSGVGQDEESAAEWRKLGVDDNHIFYYESNWWSRSGRPEQMPSGEIGGPDAEIFYDFGEGSHNGPESNESRFLEIANSVFIEYEKQANGTLQKLPQKGVDFGGGLERTLAAIEGEKDIFRTSLFMPIIQSAEEIFHASYEGNASHIRVIADHMRASIFLIKDGVIPSNKEHGYVLRRLLRRAAIKVYQMTGGTDKLYDLAHIVPPVLNVFQEIYTSNTDPAQYQAVIHDEMDKFQHSLKKGLQLLKKKDQITGKEAFDLFQSYGFPVEVTRELMKEQRQELDMESFLQAKKEHQKLSQTASVGKFRGGLAEESDQIIRYHTATHLLQQALKDVFGDTIRQEGSNITQERLRFDTHLDHKPTDEEIAKVVTILNEKIQAGLPVKKCIMKREDAEKIGALSFFREKYGNEVSVYTIGGEEGKPETAYSKEFCGGPHVESTTKIGKINIYKVEKIGAQSVRIYARS